MLVLDGSVRVMVIDEGHHDLLSDILPDQEVLYSIDTLQLG